MKFLPSIDDRQIIIDISRYINFISYNISCENFDLQCHFYRWKCDAMLYLYMKNKSKPTWNMSFYIRKLFRDLRQQTTWGGPIYLGITGRRLTSLHFPGHCYLTNCEWDSDWIRTREKHFYIPTNRMQQYLN